jgi:hypothetical protein
MNANFVRAILLLTLVIALAIWATTLIFPPAAQAGEPEEYNLLDALDCAPDLERISCVTTTAFTSQSTTSYATKSTTTTSTSSSSSTTTTSTSSNSGNIPINPPPKSNPYERHSYTGGATGGDFNSPGVEATVTFGPGVLTDGTKITIGRPYPNGLPKPSFKVVGDGDHLIGLELTDANGKPITSVTGNVTICFNLSASEIANAYPALTMQMWDGGKWVTLNATLNTSTGKFCATVQGW